MPYQSRPELYDIEYAFKDRRSVIKFVCEVPTAIDQRLFALGRTIQQEIE